MKRITVSLPDELVDEIKRVAGEGRVSAYVVRALEEYQEKESLADILAAWETENPVPDKARAWAEAELDRVGLRSQDRARTAG